MMDKITFQTGAKKTV